MNRLCVLELSCHRLIAGVRVRTDRGGGRLRRVIGSRRRLPLSFDAPALLAEAHAFAAEEWIPHFNTAYYDGDWSGISLRSVGGKPTTLYPDPAATEPFADTPALAQAPELAAALSRLECEQQSARLLRLGPGASIREHTDLRLSHPDGELRLHIPLSTDDDVAFEHNGIVVAMAPGECWYMDLTLPHAVTNRSERARIHLVVDCVVNPWLDAQLSAGADD